MPPTRPAEINSKFNYSNLIIPAGIASAFVSGLKVLEIQIVSSEIFNEKRNFLLELSVSKL